MGAKEREFGKHFANTKCGILHAQWAMEAFWGEVTQNVILPGCLAIHAALVKKGITKKKCINFNDADDDVYFIKTKDKNRKVFVHSTQSRDYLYIIEETTAWDLKTSKSLPAHNLHIRRIFRDLKKDPHLVIELEKEITINKLLQYANTLNEFHDDHRKWLSDRPSLQAYKRIDFEIPYTKEHMKERSFYGDFRDGGYILSYDGYLAKAAGPRVEGSVYSFTELTHISTIYLSCIADELEIKVPKLDGYR
jgi:hypothetical protein